MIRIRTFLALAVAAMVAIAAPFVACDVLPYAIIKPHRVTRDEIAKSLPYCSPGDMGIPADDLVVTVQDSIRLQVGSFMRMANREEPSSCCMELQTARKRCCRWPTNSEDTPSRSF